MRSTHASFVVNRICLARRDFLAPSGLRGRPRGHKGPQGGIWGQGGVVRFACRKRVGAFFWSLFCASCMLKSKIFNTVHKRSQKRICLARRHFRTFRWTALIFLGLLPRAFGGRQIVPASGERKRSVFLGFVLRVVHAKDKNSENCSQKRICLARRHFRALRWTALTALWALAARF